MRQRFLSLFSFGEFFDMQFARYVDEAAFVRRLYAAILEALRGVGRREGVRLAVVVSFLAAV